jgi:hypothetical protein
MYAISVINQTNLVSEQTEPGVFSKFFQIFQNVEKFEKTSEKRSNIAFVFSDFNPYDIPVSNDLNTLPSPINCVCTIFH